MLAVKRPNIYSHISISIRLPIDVSSLPLLRGYTFFYEYNFDRDPRIKARSTVSHSVSISFLIRCNERKSYRKLFLWGNPDGDIRLLPKVFIYMCVCVRACVFLLRKNLPVLSEDGPRVVAFNA